MIGLSPTQVKIWFQNHRYKAKKGQQDRNYREETVATNSGHARQQQPALMSLRHVKVERNLDTYWPLSPTESIPGRIQPDGGVGSGRMKDEGGAETSPADFDNNIGGMSWTSVAAGRGRHTSDAKYFESNGTLDGSYTIAASSKTQHDSPVKLSSQNWLHFSEHLARFQRQQQQQQNGGETSLTELRPMDIDGCGSTAVSASNLAVAGECLQAPAGFAFPSYYSSSYGSYVVTPVETTSASSSAHAFRTW